MDEQLQALFYSEVDQGHLAFDDDPEYSALMTRSMSLFPNEELPEAVYQLLDTSNRISFAYGIKLGLRMDRWAAP